jgi:sec-independent protein translocase protein TatA
LVFGPKKLPEIGRSFGKALRGFQDASRDFESEFTREAKQLEEAVATKKPEPEKLAAAAKEDITDS